MSTFTNFKEDFYSRVSDLSLFDCADINLLKVVLDGLKVDYVNKGNVRPYLFYPIYLQNLILKIKKYRTKKNDSVSGFLKKIEVHRNKTILISDAARLLTDADGHLRSLYFENVLNVIGKENVVSVSDRPLNAKIEYDFSVANIENKFSNAPFSKEEKIFRKEILETFCRIKKSGIFSRNELANIQFAFHRFFFQYKTWNAFLKLLPELKKSYFVCHYHKEGQILALKRNNIEAIELQHGLIAEQDIFYVFPKEVGAVKDRALFADKILVYGQYWKDVLLKGAEYSSSQIKIIGYYLYNDFSNYSSQKKYLKDLIGDKDVILITTQTFIHSHFIDYTLSLAKNITETKRNAIILLKPHPSENIETYSGVFSNSGCVKVVDNPLPLLLQISNAHVSIYSTTLYDSLRYRVKNYVYKVKEFEDYVNGIISSGVAEEIELGQNPLDRINLSKSDNELNVDYYYQEFNKDFIQI